ncbi:helix-turn-helix transcriptional regulator [Streptomyces sp. HNM0575]|uniref:PadR family transcriptional regulator n=1 Tax=Streptomyces sp. HNM0575 TaxID=2716338 RepID=UPI00145C4723|nr:PadR family transcriptional regulator [Streptomyces sp. HNM0575]NLU75993.1 helix-turn-helix transcriptional regulator [Streptomyces sp. HNM0575]
MSSGSGSGSRATPGGDAVVGWVRATLELALLAALTEGDRHGYALAQHLGDHDFGPVRGGSLYPVLSRLEAEGAVRSFWQAGEGGPGRKVYALTEAGEAKLAADRARWRDFTTVLDRILKTSRGEER